MRFCHGIILSIAVIATVSADAQAFGGRKKNKHCCYTAATTTCGCSGGGYHSGYYGGGYHAGHAWGGAYDPCTGSGYAMTGFAGGYSMQGVPMQNVQTAPMPAPSGTAQVGGSYLGSTTGGVVQASVTMPAPMPSSNGGVMYQSMPSGNVVYGSTYGDGWSSYSSGWDCGTGRRRGLFGSRR